MRERLRDTLGCDGTDLRAEIHLPGKGSAMEPQPDVLTLKGIYEAERQAERIVREAEGQAAALLRDADAEASELLDEMRRRLSLRRREALEAAVSSIEREAGELLESARVRTNQWARKRKAGIDRIVDRLLEMVLPS